MVEAMFLVRALRGRKPRAYRLDPMESVGVPDGDRTIPQKRREPRAWWITVIIAPGHTRTIGAAAIADSIEACHTLIAHLSGRDMRGERE
jgi:hypothetical protein